MILKIFTVYDSKADAFLQPFYCTTTGVAVRMFEETCSDKSHQFHKHAADYTLMELGTFDQATGAIVTLKAMTNLGNALSFLQMHNGPELVEEQS